MNKAKQTIKGFLLITAILLGQLSSNLFFSTTEVHASNIGKEAEEKMRVKRKNKNSDSIDYLEEQRDYGPDESLRNFRMQEHLGLVPPYIPIVKPPVVKAVWIPTHEARGDKDVLVGGHWVYIKIQDDSWFINEEPTDSMDFPTIIPTKSEVE